MKDFVTEWHVKNLEKKIPNFFSEEYVTKNKEKQIEVNNNHNQDFYNFMDDYFKQCIDAEREKEKEYISRAISMQSAFSFLSAVLVASTVPVIENRGSLSLTYLLVMYVLISVPLLLSIIFSTFVQNDYLHDNLGPYNDCLEDFYSKKDDKFFAPNRIGSYWIIKRYNMSRTLNYSNKIRQMFLKLSRWSFCLALILCLLLGFISIILLYGGK